MLLKVSGHFSQRSATVALPKNQDKNMALNHHCQICDSEGVANDSTNESSQLYGILNSYISTWNSEGPHPRKKCCFPSCQISRIKERNACRSDDVFFTGTCKLGIYSSRRGIWKRNLSLFINRDVRATQKLRNEWLKRTISSLVCSHTIFLGGMCIRLHSICLGVGG